ncbi:hypothetical protein PU629_17060 [Pullulanibacillus sp. KACC 23026]|nr:hypothetical protein [Pullulanibacillus sp. KACC 23026]WEG11828.1 hypothetical protein PU629_17060 [Pullulanibacillus sp. KACC 23026]
METATVQHYCEQCQQLTEHAVEESAFEIVYVCEVCGEEEQSYKTFF